MPEPRWIRFVEVTRWPNPRRTRVWEVVTKKEGQFLGKVSWYTRWRKYEFVPCPGTGYEEQCLRDIATFLEERTREQRAAVKARRTA